MKIFTLLLSVYLITSCSHTSFTTNQPQTNIQTDSTNRIEKIAEGKTLQKLSSSTGKRKLPIVKDFSVFYLYRITDNYDSGFPIPPFKGAEIKMILHNEAKAEEKVTIIPLGVEIEPFQQTILKVTKKKDTGCDEPKKDFYFDIELEEITDKIVLEIQPVYNQADARVFGVFVIYPSVDFARNISPPELKQELIPKGVAIETVEAAIDLDGDGKPDLLSLSFCCADENKPVTSEDTECNYSCEKNFKKINRSWKLVSSENPC